jgi:hypothetical protein
MEPAKRHLKPLAVINALVLIGLVVAFAAGGFFAGTKSNPVFSFVETPKARSTAPEAGDSKLTPAGKKGG